MNLKEKKEKRIINKDKKSNNFMPSLKKANQKNITN
jgi:hypothetical protein